MSAGPSDDDASSNAALKDLLISIRPRERSGARMTNRVEYQKHWAITLILGLHLGQEDYCVVFEHHDDIVVLDRVDDPQSAKFYQVKTKEHGAWKLAELLKSRDEGEGGLSIIGKMYLNKRNFPNHTEELVFVSNVPCTAPLTAGGEAGDQAETCARELTDSERAKVIERLRVEYGPEVPDEDIELFFIVHSDLALRDAESHGVGKLEEFLSRLFPHRKLRYRAIYRALLGEVSRRTGNEDLPSSYGSLIRDRAIDRDTVDNCLRQAGVHDDPDESWDIVKRFMVAEGWSPILIRRIRQEWVRYEVERMDPEKVALQEMRKRVDAIIRSTSRAGDEPLRDVLASIEARLALTEDDLRALGADCIRAMILFEYMDSYGSDELPPADPPTSEEAA